MPSIVCEHANANVIKWARDDSGVSKNDAAVSIRVDVKFYERIENGEVHPTLSQLRSLARKFRRPVAIFYLSEVPQPTKDPTDYRTLVNSKGSKLKLSIRKARRVQNYLEKLSDNQNKNFPRLELRELPEAGAQKLREYLGLTDELHLKGGDSKVFFESLQQKLEADGISILLHSFPKDEARAYSFAETPRVVVISTNDDVYGARNFSLIHELTHLGLRRSGLCIVAESHSSNSTEKYCDKVAVNFLMPEKLVRKLSEKYKPELLLDDYNMAHVANKLKCSKLALLIRYEELSIIRHADFLLKKTEWERRKPRTGGGGGQSVVANTIKENGNPLTSTVVDQYNSGSLDGPLASKILNVNQSYLEAVGKKVANG